MVFYLLAVVGYHVGSLCQLVVPDKKSSSVPIASQVFGREEGGGPDVSNAACFLLVAVAERVSGPDGLGGIFYHV